MKMSQEELQDVALFVTDFYKQPAFELYSFHNLQHTINVVTAVEIISTAEDLDKKDRLMVILAAWFHDTGYINGCEGHEEESAKIAAEYLIGKGVRENDIDTIRELILSTRHPQQPSSVAAQVICDADLLHLSDADYEEKNALLRKEWQATKNESCSDEDWLKRNINFLSNHRFFTKFCRENFEKKKQKNLRKLRDQLQSTTTKTFSLQEVDSKNEIEIKDPFTETKTDRSIDTLMRTVSQNHMRLSDAADNKANLLISINTLMASVLISGFIIKNEITSNMTFSVVIILAINVITIIFAVLATRPKLSSSDHSNQQDESTSANLLFFGNFQEFSFEDYKTKMHQLFLDKSKVYDQILLDVYLLGKVLNRKYKLLKLAYNVFMAGIIIGVLTFIISYVY
ncbi:MAG: Pycsar system effector family protein [Ginsengibacter sp.]